MLSLLCLCDPPLCPGGERVDAADLKSAPHNGGVGSNPSLGTTYGLIQL